MQARRGYVSSVSLNAFKEEFPRVIFFFGKLLEKYIHRLIKNNETQECIESDWAMGNAFYYARCTSKSVAQCLIS